MLRVGQILQGTSVKLNISRTSTSSQSIFNGILSKPSICSSIRLYSKKSTEVGKVPSIKDSIPKNLIDEVTASRDQKKDDSNKSRNKSLLWGMLFTAFTLGTIWFVRPTSNKKEVKNVVNEKKGRAVQKHPQNSEEIPKDVPYLLIGGGTASFTAFRAIKSADPTAKVLIISNENFYPYMRPPLSKEIWFNDDKESVKKHIFKQWNGSERSLFYEPEDFYIDCGSLMKASNGGVSVARGWAVTKLDVNNKYAMLDDGTQIHFNKCLIATGAKPKLSSVFEAAKSDIKTANRVKMYRDIYDFEEAHDMFEKATDVAIIGGGFLGSELACAMSRTDKNNEKKVYQIFKETGNMGKILPEYLSAWTTNKVKSEGVQVISETEVVEVKEKDNKLQLTLNNGKSLLVDFALVAIGSTPNTELAKDSGLEVDPELGGYLVNTELQARTDVYIAGDCACFYDTKLGRRRFEHHDHAVVTGRLAGENMTGARKPYLHQSMFWSDLGPDVGYEAIGIVDANLPTVAVFAKATAKDSPKTSASDSNEQVSPEGTEKEKSEKLANVSHQLDPSEGEDFGKGVVFYLKDDVVVGIVLWNVFNRMGVARQVLLDHRKYDDLNEVAKLFTIHEE
ncbi:unnamed protein product [Psylliodes chrysocephalus]|uniref:Apoptosis-inducing factor 1, mitochondrial n=1 Tax=Psylliodes chrysocephalus TaxID=3402493 RepID=A0A9P0G9L0_9CUCU|nr:unnamed protein product [Psylliodes chrysocephala]